MRKIFSRVLKVVFGRLFFYAVLIALQLATLAYLLLRLSQYSVVIFAALYILSFIEVLAVVTSDQNPSFKIAWIISILCFPLLGGLFYLAFKVRSKPQTNRHNRHMQANPALYKSQSGDISAVRDLCPWSYTQARYVDRVTGFPPLGNSTAEYCPLGEDMYRILLDELKKAESFIFIEFFIISLGEMWDGILEILKEKAAAGVDIRVMYDDIGSLPTLPRYYYRKLRKLGIKTIIFNRIKPSADPVMNYRDHRKIVVIDGRVGFCGGINLADEYINAVERFGHWKDTAVVLRGDAVASLTRVFLQMWTMTSGTPEREPERFLTTMPVAGRGFVQVFPDTPGDRYNVAENVYIQTINRADSYIYITTPYLILDNELATALRTAAESGIDVRIITPGIPDKHTVFAVTRSNYLPLLASGVKIYEYSPGFIHAKMALSDDCSAVVGTANLDYRSLYLHYECAVALYDIPQIADIKADFLDTLGRCREITLAEMENKSLPTRFIYALLELFAPLM